MKDLVIGGASGFWGDASSATGQLLTEPALDYLIYDYLAEITLSIMARARAADPDMGYAVDFVSDAMATNIQKIAESGVKVVSNAGGLNPGSCARALQQVCDKAGVSLKIAVIEGDDLMDHAANVAQSRTDMFTDIPAPDTGQIISINAYLGAFPIAEALAAGADIVITGRCVDSALTLGPCIAHFGWKQDDYDRLAQGSLAGHLIECGPQATGGNFTDWDTVATDLDSIGYPLVTMADTGIFTLSKPDATGGIVNKASVAEQLVYEIGDPARYELPDVICDFCDTEIREIGPDLVRVSGARGQAPGASYKTCLTYKDGYKSVVSLAFIALDAGQKALAYAAAVKKRCEKRFLASNLGPFSEWRVDRIGAGDFSTPQESAEVVVKIAAKHPDKRALQILAKETVALGLATPAGMTLMSSGLPKPSPVVRLFSYMTPKTAVPCAMTLDGDAIPLTVPNTATNPSPDPIRHVPPAADPGGRSLVEKRLIDLAWARSGDKGDKANIGVIARDPAFLPWIARSLTPDRVADIFAFCGPKGVDQFYMPGIAALNYLLHDALGGGGVASLHADPQGKTFGQILLMQSIDIPADLVQNG